MTLDDAAIKEIEDALIRSALSHEACTSAIDHIAKHTHSRGAAILPIKGRVPGLPISPSCEDLMHAYFKAGWAEHDHRISGIPKLLSTGILVDQDVSSPEFMRKSPYYNDFLGRFGFKWFAGVRITAGDDIWCLTLQRSSDEGFFTADEQATALRLSAPIERAAHFAQIVAEARFNGMTDTLDTLTVAALLVNRVGRVVHVNRLADQLLGSLLDLEHGQLSVPNDRQATVAVRRHLEAAIWDNFKAHDAALAPVTVSASGRPALVLSAMPLRSNGLEFFRGARVIVTIKDLRKPPEFTHGSLRTTYGLTGREIDLCQRLMNGHSIKAVADELGISLLTARTHLKRIIAKTETNRQSELIVLLTQFSRMSD
ncbi:helix-turn-helix transcriptional regulator [Methylobacterium sp. J-067]|uniref:helix-turn-helix transcriptional regulator n=1 Tax=Methylobacterium sp. J-067 TaxID=2836648 RepID=UPI001FBA4AC6|nr:helix-turn-helix transcriptional regulator [Methylobacterium sp. J-067]MCJ2023440.1 helix-turn-helix transcriptional regulator [Methylobacterium sp. J-067]